MHMHNVDRNTGERDRQIQTIHHFNGYGRFLPSLRYTDPLSELVLAGKEWSCAGKWRTREDGCWYRWGRWSGWFSVQNGFKKSDVPGRKLLALTINRRLRCMAILVTPHVWPVSHHFLLVLWYVLWMCYGCHRMVFVAFGHGHPMAHEEPEKMDVDAVEARTFSSIYPAWFWLT